MTSDLVMFANSHEMNHIFHFACRLFYVTDTAFAYYF